MRPGKLITALIALGLAFVHFAPVAAAAPNPRIFILMVWDGLRPDFVTARDTPNLFALARDGVRFDRHHSIYPTLTMVNAAALATGAAPGADGILANVMDLAPALRARSGVDPAVLAETAQPLALEDSKILASLNSAGGFDGHLLGLDTIVQEAAREGGYVAVAGKRGPTFVFDNRIGQQSQATNAAPPNYLFAADDLILPADAAAKYDGALAALPKRELPARQHDEFFTRLMIETALPAAKDALRRGHPALLVLWMHDPDITQHIAGLGTIPALVALGNSDADLGRLRRAVDQDGLADRTDLMVVSDHGFATIRLVVSLKDLLVAAGLKQSADSSDVIVVPDGGSDFIYLSRDAFPTEQARRDRAQKIVNFAAAQEWCGPIFSLQPALPPASAHGHRRSARKDYLGWIDGTFSEAAVGLYNADRSPDLVISFREISDLVNSGLTGPGNPAFVIGASGQQAVANKSRALAKPIKGLLYADDGARGFTTGMGMHGAAGSRELHNFGAAIGPDFRPHFVDRSPTGNSDVTPTITAVLGLHINVGPGAAFPSGRVMSEALDCDGAGAGATRFLTETASLELQGMRVVTTLKLVRAGNHDYLDDSSVQRIPLGHSP